MLGSVMVAYIYALCDPDSGEVRYVGKACDPKARFGYHLRDRKRTWKSYWVKSLRKLGKKPVMEIIEKCGDDWPDAERFYISYFRFLGMQLTNLDSGGNGGKNLHPETRKKIAHTLKGRPTSEETRRKIGAAHKGRIVSEETRKKLAAVVKNESAEIREKRSIAALSRDAAARANITAALKSPERRAKISAALKGRGLSQEHRENLSVSHRGQGKLTVEQVAQVRAEYANGGATHRSLAAKYGVTHTAIGELLRGEHWSYV